MNATIILVGRRVKKNDYLVRLPTIAMQAPMAWIRRWVSLFCACSLILLPARRSVAQDSLTTIALTDGVPDKSLPLGSDFILTGNAAPNVMESYAVFVRVAWPFLGSGQIEAGVCAKLKAELTAKDKVTDKSIEPKLTPASARRSTVKDIWPSVDSGMPTLVATPWSRAKEADTAYRLLVPGSPFFRQGASYCMFIVQRTKETNPVDIDYKKLLETYAKDPTDANVTILANKIETEFQGAVGADDAMRAIRLSLIDAAPKLVRYRASLSTKFGRWKFKFPRQAPPTAARYDANSPLGFVLLELLASKGAIGHAPYEVKTGNVTATIQRVGVASDFSKFVVDALPNGATADAKLLDVDVATPAGTVTFPDSKISVESAWRFAEGYIKLDAGYERIDELTEKYLPKTSASRIPVTFTDVELRHIDVLRAAFRDYSDLLTWVYGESTDCVPKLNTNRAQAVRGEVMRTDAQNARALVDATAQLISGAFGPQKACELRQDLSDLDTEIEEYGTAARNWNAAPAVVRKTVAESWMTDTFPIMARTGLTQKRWFDTYFTLTVGRVNVRSESASYSEYYTGVQVFGWANPVNEPMWINGADLDIRRAFALELAIIPKTGQFGADNRFSGFNGPGTPALMVGVAAQLIPYVSLSAGGIWENVKKTRIAGETNQDEFQPYIAISVQANVPGMIRTLATKPGSQASAD